MDFGPKDPEGEIFHTFQFLFRGIDYEPPNCTKRHGLFLFAGLLLLIHFADFSRADSSPADNAVEQKQNKKKQTYEKKIRQARRKLKKNPSSYNARFQLARNLSFAGKYQKAIKQYSRLLKNHPNHPDVRLGRGRVYAWQEQFERAEEDLTTVTRNHPEYADAWHALGDLYLWWGRPGKAVDAYKKWKRNAPDAPQADLSLARARLEMKQFDQVDGHLRRAKKKGASGEDVQEIRRSLNRSPGRFPWRLRYTFQHTSFLSRFEDWRVHTFQVTREFDQGTIGVITERQDRFGNIDTRAGFDLYHDLWNGAYGNIRYLGSFEADVTPKSDVFTRLYQNLGNEFTVIPGYRHMDFPAEPVNIYSLGLGKHVGSFYVEAESQFSPDDNGDSITYLSKVRYNWTTDDFIEFIGSYGDRTVTLSNDQILRDRSSWSISARAKHMWSPRWGTELSFQYYDEEDVPIRRTTNISLFFRW